MSKKLINLDEEYYRKLKKIAALEEVSVKSIVNQLIKEYVDESELLR
ncbi:MAG: hypothetical protein LBV42_05655 [Methanobrevibacter sp.]|jgi:predicted DNA-binding ribbon-helix-helix protein|nr:hypothetical protein [Methanobrevibacter sp.]